MNCMVQGDESFPQCPTDKKHLDNDFLKKASCCAHSSFNFSPTCSLLLVTVGHCLLLFRAVPNFFSKFQCNFTLVEKVIKFYNIVYCCVRHRFFRVPN